MREPIKKNDCEQRDPKEVALVMQALRSAIENYPFTFAVFSRHANVEYLFGYRDCKSDFLVPALEFCEKSFLLQGVAVSNNFYDWTTFDFRYEKTSLSGFTSQILDQVLTLGLDEGN